MPLRLLFRKDIMKFYILYVLILIVAFFEAGCTTNPETGEAELFGIMSVESVVDTVEPAAEQAAQSGGVLGIAGTMIASVIAYWRRRKELAEKANAEKAKAVAISVIDGIDVILKKASDANAEGGSWAPSKDELLAILKAVQNNAGTRNGVNEILAEKIEA